MFLHSQRSNPARNEVQLARALSTYLPRGAIVSLAISGVLLVMRADARNPITETSPQFAEKFREKTLGARWGDARSPAQSLPESHPETLRQSLRQSPPEEPPERPPEKPGPLEVDLDDDGMLAVAGKRVFVFGCYYNPGTSEGLEDLRGAGFNLVLSRAERGALDQISRAGLLAWIPLGMRIAPSSDTEEQRLLEAVLRLRDHPALAVWEVPDEALWNVWYLRQGRLEAERAKRAKLLEERERAGEDVAPVRKLLSEEAALRSRADWKAAEALDREIRKLLGAPDQNPDIQTSRAPQAAEDLLGRLLRGYRALRGVDTKPVWMNYAPRNTLEDMRRFAQAADVVGCDIYPVPAQPPQGHSDLANRQLSSVGDYTVRFQQVGGRRPVWMVLQGFGWSDIHPMPEDAPEGKGRRPTRAESRFMLYDAIVHGARGVLYWGCNYAQDPPAFWEELRSVVREAASLGSVWAARDLRSQPEVCHLPTPSSVDRPPCVLAKQLEGRTYLLVVNEHEGGLGVQLRGMQSLEGARASLVGAGHGCGLEGGRVEQGALGLFLPGLSAVVVVLDPGT